MSSRRCAMPSRPLEPRLGALLLALACAAGVPAAAQPLTRDAVDAQADAMRREAQAAAPPVRMEKVLRWKDSDRPPPPASPRPPWLVWLADLLDWVNRSGRVLVWVALAALAVLLLLRWRRWFGGVAGDGGERVLQLPTHVQSLDIGPASLPADIGGAALALWQAGQVGPALSLLYRGTLSRLVHDHAVPIRASSTEGDCLRLAQPRLDGERLAYLRRLVDAWRRTVYAGRPAGDDEGRALCQGFGRHWPPGELA